MWTGHLTKGDTPGTVKGYLEDTWHWRVELTGTIDKENGGYVLQGRLGKVPENLRLEGIDDAPDKAGQR